MSDPKLRPIASDRNGAATVAGYRHHTNMDSIGVNVIQAQTGRGRPTDYARDFEGLAIAAPGYETAWIRPGEVTWQPMHESFARGRLPEVRLRAVAR